MTKKAKFYAVKNGRNPGVYLSWEDCQQEITCYSGAIYKSFSTIDEANAWLRDSINESQQETNVASKHNHKLPIIGTPEVINPTPSASRKKTSKTKNASILKMRSTNIVYTPDQEAALISIANFITDKKVIQNILVGFAGTGKTTCAENIINFAKSKGYQTILTAPTNVAVKILHQKLANVVSKDAIFKTLHALLYGAPDKDGNWVPKEDLANNTFILVDESSMIEASLYNDLINAAQFSRKVKILFMGDNYQLEPVGNDPHILDNPDLKLETVKRQADTSPILALATAIRTQKKVLTPILSTPHPDIEVLSIPSLKELYLSKISTSDPDQIIYITATNRTRCAVNKAARIKRFGIQNVANVQETDQLIFIANSNHYINCDRLTLQGFEIIDTLSLTINKKNMPYVVNAELIITDDNRKIILFPFTEQSSIYHSQISNPHLNLPPGWHERNEKSKKYEVSKEVSIATYGYAITGHKSQGSQYPLVFVHQDFLWDNPRWQYTAVTRAAKTLYIAQNSRAVPYKLN